MSGDVVSRALREYWLKLGRRLRKNRIGIGRVERLVSRMHGSIYEPRLAALKAERERLRREFVDAAIALQEAETEKGKATT